MKLRSIVVVVALMLCSLYSLAADDAVVKEVRGAVEVRRGISEGWNMLQAGESLRPEDTIRTGKNSTARIIVEGRQIRIPAQTIVDVSDFRNIELEEFLLRLAMENILSVPPREDSSVSIVPAVETSESPELPESPELAVNEPAAAEQVEIEEGAMLLQGAKVLYDNAFYAMSILQTKEVFRLYPTFRSDIDARMRVAYSFEWMRLMNEALTVYSGLLGEQLPALERAAVQRAIERIRNLQNQH